MSVIVTVAALPDGERLVATAALPSGELVPLRPVDPRGWVPVLTVHDGTIGWTARRSADPAGEPCRSFDVPEGAALTIEDVT